LAKWQTKVYYLQRITAAVFLGANIHDRAFIDGKQGFIKPKHNDLQVIPLITWQGFPGEILRGLKALAPSSGWSRCDNLKGVRNPQT